MHRLYYKTIFSDGSLQKVAAVFANMELRTPKHDVFEDEILKIDFSEQSAVLEGKVIEFTPKEYRTLFYL